MSDTSVQAAHDFLLGHAPQVSHADCPLCRPGSGTTKVEEVAVAEERTFTEAQHFALLSDAVTRETASLSSLKEGLENSVTELQAEKAAVEADNSTLQSRIDVLEAEKAAAEQARDTAVAEFEAHKSAEAERVAAQARLTERVAAVKAAASGLGEDYFTDARAQRWAEMSEESFTALVADLTEAASAVKPATEVASSSELRETAAFTGGQSPTAGSGVSLFGEFLTKTGHAPARV